MQAKGYVHVDLIHPVHNQVKSKAKALAAVSISIANDFEPFQIPSWRGGTADVAIQDFWIASRHDFGSRSQ
jgi:hypothetical protein